MKAHLGSLLRALLALQGPVDPPVLATPATVFFHLCEPSRGVWAITKTAIRLWAQCCSHTAGEVGETHRWPLFFIFHFTKILRCCLGFVFLGLLLGLFWIQLKSLCNAVLLSYFPFFEISYPLLWRDAFLVNSHVFQDHEMTPVWKKNAILIMRLPL